MNAKLTLTIEEKVITTAKRYAQRKGKSLSHIVENYLKSIASKDVDDTKLSPKVSKLMGVINLPQDFDYKKDIGAEIAKKYKK